MIYLACAKRKTTYRYIHTYTLTCAAISKQNLGKMMKTIFIRLGACALHVSTCHHKLLKCQVYNFSKHTHTYIIDSFVYTYRIFRSTWLECPAACCRPPCAAHRCCCSPCRHCRTRACCPGCRRSGSTRRDTDTWLSCHPRWAGTWRHSCTPCPRKGLAYLQDIYSTLTTGTGHAAARGQPAAPCARSKKPWETFPATQFCTCALKFVGRTSRASTSPSKSMYFWVLFCAAESVSTSLGVRLHT